MEEAKKESVAIKMVGAALFKKPLKGWLKQVRMRGAVDSERGRKSNVHQMIVGLFMHHHAIMDVELIVNPTDEGVSIIIPKKCPWSTFQLKRAYKKPCGSMEVQFEFKRKRVYRRERPLKPHQALLSWQRE